eukprot:TRINITY_DN577_c0_g2_i8.p1 TRINITY_DN577_c0_g2~~TRINITY_DN577_c0_g2_i8.p1  ORF type:complete len:150 (-),score=4.08 TRINITY_DN577_c0_g2_i8:260-709(-)
MPNESQKVNGKCNLQYFLSSGEAIRLQVDVRSTRSTARFLLKLQFPMSVIAKLVSLGSYSYMIALRRHRLTAFAKSRYLENYANVPRLFGPVSGSGPYSTLLLAQSQSGLREQALVLCCLTIHQRIQSKDAVDEPTAPFQPSLVKGGPA